MPPRPPGAGPLLAQRNPIRGTFFGCCAPTEKQSANTVAQRESGMNFLRMGLLHLFCRDLKPEHWLLRLLPRLSTLVPCHLITLSARAKTLGGMVSPICLAALRVMMNSNFFGCST